MATVDQAIDALMRIEPVLHKPPLMRRRWPLDLRLDGQDLQTLRSSSRCVFRMDGHVVKAIRSWEMHYLGMQSWHEYATWQTCIADTDIAYLFAATHAYAAIPVKDEDGEQGWVELSLQSFVDEGTDRVERRLHDPYDECVNHVQDAFPDISDVDGGQCVFDAQRGHYVLVDYGLWDDWPCARAHEHADNAISLVHEKVGIGEKVLVKGGVDPFSIV